MVNILKIVAALICFAVILIILNTFTAPPLKAVQRGYRGTGMDQFYEPAELKKQAAANQVPAPEDKVDPAGQKSSEVYSNVKVLGDLDANEFIRLMTAMTNWVAPQQGCAYCHTDNPAEDTLYTKVVARRMLQMTKHINADWKPHVASTGVTCYTCHRGNPVPQNIWFDEAPPPHAGGFAQAAIGKNTPSSVVGSASLPNDVFKPFLEEAHNIRVVGTTALPENPQASIKQTEWTYGLMVHFSESLGVNCTYCHNSRSFSDWSQSSPARGTAWYGIRMVRNLNVEYLDPLTSTFPAARLGPHGDGPKVNCLTCHQGVYKPLFGASMLGDYPELADNK
jgi:photosynthetic reaction center cytochrome c subunit